jgi:hypothetical protein
MNGKKGKLEQGKEKIACFIEFVPVFHIDADNFVAWSEARAKIKLFSLISNSKQQTTNKPCRCSNAATTELSTPPDMAATTRFSLGWDHE